jgi:membrane associated rhomboid family serine protease
MSKENGRERILAIMAAIFIIAGLLGATGTAFYHSWWAGLIGVVVSAVVAYFMIKRIPKKGDDETYLN